MGRLPPLQGHSLAETMGPHSPRFSPTPCLLDYSPEAKVRVRSASVLVGAAFQTQQSLKELGRLQEPPAQWQQQPGLTMSETA